MEGVKARLQVSTTPDGDRRLLPNLLRIVRTLGLTRGLYRGISSQIHAPVALCIAFVSGRPINVMDGRWNVDRVGADGALPHDQLGLLR